MCSLPFRIRTIFTQVLFVQGMHTLLSSVRVLLEVRGSAQFSSLTRCCSTKSSLMLSPALHLSLRLVLMASGSVAVRSWTGCFGLA